MSVAAATARVAELQALLASVAPGARVAAPASPPTTAPAAQTAFASALVQAQQSAPVTAPAATAPVAGAGLAGVPYAQEIQAAAARHGIDPALLAGLVQQESGFNANAVSQAGARGLTQLMPGTAAALGVSDPLDPAQALDGGAKYLRQMLDAFGGDVTLALAGYNAGPGNVRRHGGVPPFPETQAYVRRVQAYADGYRRTAPASSTLSYPTT